MSRIYGALFLATMACVVVPLPASAQYVGTTAPLFPTLIVPLFPNATTIPFTGSSAIHQSAPKAAPASTRIPASVASQVDLNAADLATHFPSDLRGTMKANYVQSFGAFKQFERKLSLPDNDVATAISSYIAGNYMFLHGVELPDAAFLKVVAQVRHGLEESKGFPRIALQTRRKMYEQTAMVGMFMAVAQLSRKTATENPATVSNLQDSARANLAMVLGQSAANLRIDGEGMHF
jgi:hypothetical protein